LEGAYVWVCTVSANISPSGDHDWYELNAGHDYCEYVRVKLSDIADGCNYDMELRVYMAGGYLSEPLAGSYNPGSADEEIVYWPDTWESVFLKVYPVGGCYSSQDYSLYINYY